VSLAVVAVIGWAVTLVVVGVVAWALARAAAEGDREELQRLRAASEQFRERRVGPPDRRAGARSSEGESPGRRRDDVLRAELERAREALRESEARAAQAESRRTPTRAEEGGAT
jgi:hypothetical protein